MNETIKTQLDHRTIREFTDEKISDEILETLLDVANQTASSNGMQNSSIIRITDQDIKDELASIGNQEYMRRCPELFIFIVDLYRNYNIAKEMGNENDIMIGFDKFIQGFTDGVLQSQNFTVAAESLGLGANFYGNIHNDTKKVIELLKMPKLTYPIVGVGIGYPNQKPQLKPRMPLSNKVYTNSYEIKDSYLDSVKEYDKEMRTYYDLRDANKRSDAFSTQILKKQGSQISNREEMFDTLIEQGFAIKNNWKLKRGCCKMN